MTKKPLRELVPSILAHINRYKDTLQFNHRLYKVDEGQLRTEIEDSLRREMISTAAYHRVIERIPSINVLKKATDKLSKVYSQAPIRTTEDKLDQEIVDAISKKTDVDSAMTSANRLYNLQRMCAIEPFVSSGKQQLRVIPGHQCLAFSDDDLNPSNMTVFIKFMGTEKKQSTAAYDDSGRKISTEDEPRFVDIFHLFSDEEFMIIDSEGHQSATKMAEMPYPWSLGINPYGVIPHVYVNASSFELVPYPNRAGLDIAVLIPKLLADLNYAAQFLSHSIIWTKNASLEGAEIHPDTIIELGEGSPESGQPEIGTINPQVNITETLQLIEFELSGYLSSIGIKGASVSAMLPGREASGFAKAMDEGDVTAERNAQTEQFKRYEAQLWAKLAILQDYWSSAGLVDEKRKFSKKFAENFSVKFGDMKHLVSQKEKIEKVQTLRNLKLMSQRQAIKELNPDFTPDQLDAYMAELEEDNTNNQVEPTGQVEQFNGQQTTKDETANVGPNKNTAV